MTENPLSLIYAACRQYYSASFAGDISEKEIDDKKKESFAKKVVKSGHESSLKHVKFTFAIGGVSQALTRQLVRHRVVSYSQQSQRYVKEENFECVISAINLAAVFSSAGPKCERLGCCPEGEKFISGRCL